MTELWRTSKATSTSSNADGASVQPGALTHIAASDTAAVKACDHQIQKRGACDWKASSVRPLSSSALALA